VYLWNFIDNCGLVNIIAEKHGPDVPKTHIRGSKQIDFACLTPRLTEFVIHCGLLDFDMLCKSNHLGIFLDIATKGCFGTPPEHLPPSQCRKLKLNDPRISDAYRCALRKQFEQHNVYRRVKGISTLSEYEAKCEGLYRDIGRAMEHVQNVCSTRKLHTTTWSKISGRVTHDIRYWDV
jgi:hypothetical protein